MINTNLILIDGIPGCGKSTTAQWLNQQLNGNGINSSWYFELDKSNPIRSLYSVKDTGVERMVNTGIADWKSFIVLVSDSDNVTVMDGALFQKTILTLFDNDISHKRIIDFATSVEEVISELNPTVIYFYPDDVNKHVTENNKLRGEKFTTSIEKYITNTPYAKARGIDGLEGQIQFWREHEKLCSKLLAVSRFRKLTINMAEQNWPDYQRKILNFLGLSEYPISSVPLQGLTKYTGVYEEANSDLECHVSKKGKELSIQNLMSPLEKESILLHKRNDTFTVRGAAIDLEFQSHDNESQMSLSVNGTWKRIDGKKLTRTNTLGRLQ